MILTHLYMFVNICPTKTKNQFKTYQQNLRTINLQEPEEAHLDLNCSMEKYLKMTVVHFIMVFDK
jgi:hypothetical protein